MTKDLINRLDALGIKLELTEESIKFISKAGFDVEYGARPLKRAIQRELEDELSEEILLGAIKKGYTVIAEVEDNRIVFKTKE